MTIKTTHSAPQKNSQAIDFNKARAREILLRVQRMNALTPKPNR